MRNGVWIIAAFYLLGDLWSVVEAVPLRLRRQLQDLPYIQDGIPLQNYDQSDDGGIISAVGSPVIQGDTADISTPPLSDGHQLDDHHGNLDAGHHGNIQNDQQSNPENSHHDTVDSEQHGSFENDLDSGHHDNLDGFHAEQDAGSSQTGLAYERRQNGLLHDLDIDDEDRDQHGDQDGHAAEELPMIDHDIENHRRVPNNRLNEENGDLDHGAQGSSSRVHSGSVQTSPVSPVQGQGQSQWAPTNHSHGRRGLEFETDTSNRSNSQHFLLSAVDTEAERHRLENINTSRTSSVPLHGNQPFRSTTRTVGTVTRLQSTRLQSTTTRVTVKAVEVHHEETGQPSHGQGSDSGGDIGVAVDGTIGEHPGSAQISSAGQPQQGEGQGHVAVLPGEHSEQGQGQEQHLHEHSEHEGPHSGVDVPIDKGDHPHEEHEHEHEEPSLPRRTNTPHPDEHHENIPSTGPVSSTPKLVILPTPAQPEQNHSSENLEPLQPHNPEHHPGETNHEGEGHPEPHEPHHEGEGHESEHGHGQLTPGEGHIEYITEEPSGGHEEIEKPNKDNSKHEGKTGPEHEEPFSSVQPSMMEYSSLVPSEHISNTLTSSFHFKVTESVESSKNSMITSEILKMSTFYYTPVQHLTSKTVNSEESTSVESSLSSSLSSESVIFSSRNQIYSTDTIHTTETSKFSAVIATSSSSFEMLTNIGMPSLSTHLTQLAHTSVVMSTSTVSAYETALPGTRSSSIPTLPATPTFPSVAIEVSTVRTSGSSSLTPSMATQRTTSVKSETSPVLTSPSTTKIKLNRTAAAPTPATSKKNSTVKGPVKPENGSTTSRSSSNLSQTTKSTTHRPVQSTPPAVYIEIQLRMDWSEFCLSEHQFITEIMEILQSKEPLLSEEQLKFTAEVCGNVNNIMLGSEGVTSITIRLYIVDRNGKIDITMTMVASSAIYKGFLESNYFKDKVVSVQYYPGRTTSILLPEDSREERIAPPGVTMVIVIASVGGGCCVALIILQVVLLHRRVKAKKKLNAFVGARASVQSMDHVALGVIPKSRPCSGYWNPALDDTQELPEPEELSHIMNFSTLANFCMDISGIHTEFQTIPFDSIDTTSVPVGEEDKNRFANVLPHKHTKVKLVQADGDKSDYINANYVNGYMGQKHAYIATQSPLVNTAEDFWRMVWQEQTRAILMLNPLTAQGKPKQSTCYWPDNLETDFRREYGDYAITLKNRDVQHDYIDCTLEIMDIEKNLKREIHHFWFTCWPDTGPPEPLAFVKFVLDTRPRYENSGAPVVVHCGPGTGRTGAFIAVDMCMRMFEDRRRVDILNCVHRMRCERAGAVQTKEQYTLIYQALNQYAVILSSPSISTRSSVITLHAML